MAYKIHGILVTIIEQVQTGEDPFGAPIYEDNPIPVDNVLVAPVKAEEIVDHLNLYGKRAVYQLGIPKGDTHNWENQIVHFFGRNWRTFGAVTEGIEDLIPLDWNRKVMVERIEQSTDRTR